MSHARQSPSPRSPSLNFWPPDDIRFQHRAALTALLVTQTDVLGQNTNYLIALAAALSFAIDSAQLGNRVGRRTTQEIGPSPDNGTMRPSICILSFSISEMSAHRHRGVKSP